VISVSADWAQHPGEWTKEFTAVFDAAEAFGKVQEGLRWVDELAESTREADRWVDDLYEVVREQGRWVDQLAESARWLQASPAVTLGPSPEALGLLEDLRRVPPPDGLAEPTFAADDVADLGMRGGDGDAFDTGTAVGELREVVEAAAATIVQESADRAAVRLVAVTLLPAMGFAKVIELGIGSAETSFEIFTLVWFAWEVTRRIYRLVDRYIDSLLGPSDTGAGSGPKR
jgi:hypothetical protein